MLSKKQKVLKTMLSIVTLDSSVTREDINKLYEQVSKIYDDIEKKFPMSNA